MPHELDGAASQTVPEIRTSCQIWTGPVSFTTRRAIEHEHHCAHIARARLSTADIMRLRDRLTSVLEEQSGTPITWVSVGPKRNQTLERR